MATKTQKSPNILQYEGCNFFRQRLVISTLSGKTVRIKNIRAEEDDPGIKGDDSFDCESADRPKEGSLTRAANWGEERESNWGAVSGNRNLYRIIFY